MRGQQAEVFHCNLLNCECVLRRWTNSRKMTEVSCLTCQSRQPK
jgi:hypothetical protein